MVVHGEVAGDGEDADEGEDVAAEIVEDGGHRSAVDKSGGATCRWSKTWRLWTRAPSRCT
ncbi:hypothetical protein [Saccharomonospora sp. CUA-673]|uniref:hypothetical protein n=1 Tax=Saccharomonospora sp. CUA-673 TaxID=1904969 RepID=UPI001C9E7A5B|nr:hypothetical protein [Saccharomonospora sp. CUA-673]